MKQYRICGTKEPCNLKVKKRCGLSGNNSCKYQGAKVMIYETKEQALKQVVEECQ